MFSRSKKEKLPWYRKPGYKGNLTEEEKRELDSLRWRAEQPGGRHPATEFADLPEEVQSYISKIEIEHYDAIQEQLVGRVFLLSGTGAIYLVSYFGWLNIKWNQPELAFLSGCLVIVPWIYYIWKWRKNAGQFLVDGNEGIRTEWERAHIASKKMRG